MKIEMGESLALSYLKHVRKCVFYQANWKSSSQWSGANENVIPGIFDEFKKHLDPELPSGWEQFLKQAEIDALGMDQEGKIYVIDIAYHEGRLNYGGRDETIRRVMKKSLRSYLILLRYFPKRQYEIIFASPKVGPEINALITENFEKLKEIVPTDNDSQVEFNYLSNEKFSEEILDKTIKASANDSDTGELFLRAYRLYQLSKLDKTTTSEERKTN